MVGKVTAGLLLVMLVAVVASGCIWTKQSSTESFTFDDTGSRIENEVACENRCQELREEFVKEQKSKKPWEGSIIRTEFECSYDEVICESGKCLCRIEWKADA